MASEKKITMREYNGTDYDTLYPKTIAEQVDGVYSQTETNALLAKKPNPNLLDNPYFGNPVDQRQGYVVPPGVAYTNVATSETGTTETYSAVDRFDEVGKAVFVYKGAVCTCDRAAAVRGYAGAGYGLDRWKQLYDSTYCLIQDGYVSFYGLDFGQMIGTKIIPLNIPLTYSVLTAEGILGSITFQFNGTKNQTVFGPIGETKFKANFIYNWGGTYTPFFLQTEGNVINVVAMKLELGDQQTLAHQENGVWVLNEIPNYWEELLKCIQSTADPSDTFANKTVLHTGNAQALGFTKIAIGSYVGTGTYYSNNPNSLTFDFEPKMLAVVAGGSTLSCAGFLIVRGQTYSNGIGSYSSSSVALNLNITWAGKTVSWWSSNEFDSGKQYAQMNAQGVTYFYVALG